MTWRLVGLAIGAVLYFFVFLAAIHGSTTAAGVLVTVTALVLLVGGGNWLQHWLGIRRRPPQFAEPPRHLDEGPGREGER
ncbi:MAG TPA: hypothetical protein VIE15_06440 [Acidimicrobiales bacterium]|jgi:hypothetical protein